MTRRVLRPLLSVLATALPAALAAQSPAPRPTLGPAAQAFVRVSAPVVAITNAMVIDGTGAPARRGQTVVLQDGLIRAVGPSASVTVPAGATVIDGTGHTVIPGIV
ncbi:MAG: hypothetical protein RLZ32_908, partial [Gemmatimonadota bacterium]